MSTPGIFPEAYFQSKRSDMNGIEKLPLCWSEPISICGRFQQSFFQSIILFPYICRGWFFHLLLGSGVSDRERRGWNRCSWVEFPPLSYGNRQDLLCPVCFVQHKLAFLKDSQEFGSQNIEWNIMDDENNGSTLSRGDFFTQLEEP